MKKWNKKKGITVAVILGIIVVVAVNTGLGREKEESPINTISLEQGAISSSISVSGTVKSADTYSVYSKETLAVEKLYVEKGDTVKAGQVLAELDTTNLEKDLKTAEINLQASMRNAEKEKENVDSNTSGMEKSLESARLSLEKQKLSYDTAKTDYEKGTNTEIQNAKSALDRAEIELSTSLTAYENAKQLYAAEVISKNEMTAAENSYTVAKLAHADALENHTAAVDRLKKTFDQAKLDLDSAQNGYETAQLNLKTAQQQRTDSYTATIEQQQLEIERLKQRLADCTITAPADGTVTVVNIEEGQTPAGILFEIENTNELIVTTYVKDYDIANASVGQEVIIKSDATGDEEIAGQVKTIAPTTRKDSSSNNEFEVEIEVIGQHPALKIGMETRLNIITDKKDEAFYVSYDAVTVNEEGQEVIYVLENEQMKEIAVQTGIESDAYIEIQGEGLTQGMEVISDTAAVME